MAADGHRSGVFEFRLLGPVAVSLDGQPVPLAGALQRGLLAALILEGNRVVDTDRLISRLWGATPPKSVRPGLQWQVSRLRRLLTAHDGARLTFRPPGYVVRVRAGELDLDEFQCLADQGRRCAQAGDAAGAARLFQRAARMWRGRAMENVDLPGFAAERLRLDERRADVLEDYLDASLRLGRHRELLTEFDEAVTEFPLRERLHELHLLALYRAGHVSEAVVAYHRIRRRLAEELGLDPGEQLQQMLHAILSRDPVLDLPASHRATASHHAAMWADPVPAQLPSGIAGFTGRDPELGRLTELHRAHGRQPGTLLIAITGPAGVGKSALAARWAQQTAGDFERGQLYAQLGGPAGGPPRGPLKVLAHFLRALGVPTERVPADLDEAAALYRSLLVGKRMLVLLDDVNSAAQVRPLLPGEPGCAVVMTSRHRLLEMVAHDGARELCLGPLSEDDALALVRQIVGDDRVAAEPDSARHLVRLCRCLPLALRIAATTLISRADAGIAALVADLRGNRTGLPPLLAEARLAPSAHLAA